MKPCSRNALKSNNLLQNIGYGQSNTVAKIKGTTKMLGIKYKNALVVLYNKENLQPLCIVKPSEMSEYEFSGLNTSLNTFEVAFDLSKQYNALIQDSVVPK